MRNPGMATQLDDRSTNLNPAKTMMAITDALFIQQDHFLEKTSRDSSLPTQHVTNQHNSCHQRLWFPNMWHSGFSTLKNKTKQNKKPWNKTRQINQPTTKYFPISLPGDISFTVPSPNIFQKYLIWQTEIISPQYHVSILWIKLISPPTIQRFSKWDSKEDSKSVFTGSLLYISNNLFSSFKGCGKWKVWEFLIWKMHVCSFCFFICLFWKIGLIDGLRCLHLMWFWKRNL